MTAATTDRNTPAQYLQREWRLDLGATAVIPAGVMVCTDAAGDAQNADNLAGLSAVKGRSAHSADAVTDGDEEIVLDRGVFGLAGSAALIAAGRAMIGKIVYVVDNVTVGLRSDASVGVRAGRLEEIEAGRFYVSLGLDTFDDTGFETLANSAVSPAVATSTGVKVMWLPIANAATADYDFVVPEKMEIIDAHALKEGAGAGNSYQLQTGAGTAISDAIAAAVDKAITRAGTLDILTRVLAAGATLRVHAINAAGSTLGKVAVYYIPRA